MNDFNSDIRCSFDQLTNYHKFFLLKIFSEVDKDNKQDLILIEKEPIDVVIKYIDLEDPSLKKGQYKTNIKRWTTWWIML